MSCWCGHGPWHYHGYHYPPAAVYAPPPPSPYYPETEPYGPPRRRRPDAEELAEYLHGLEEEMARIRREIDDLRRADTGES
ncbi:hypothetical protein R1CP_37070 (plasmid) [Rhodococcus opacus]|uniref:Uncharacterized protein n=2 Tax=Rhodococcus opacus TaxID=37919 RepID=A0A1B1KHI4_RHOOP|nr:hypothetical protein R1CP_37070 [Rhodococcus opacus]